MTEAPLTKAEAEAKAAQKAKNKEYFAEVLELLEPFGDVTGKAMFGGYGFWECGDMFALISSGGKLYFKADENGAAAFRTARATQFAPEMSGDRAQMAMPYWTVPASVLKNDARLAEWTARAIAVGHATSKKRRAKNQSQVKKHA